MIDAIIYSAIWIEQTNKLRVIAEVVESNHEVYKGITFLEC
jgi:hypothetical protein